MYRVYTEEEKQKIIRTRITIECFDTSKFADGATSDDIARAIDILESHRQKVAQCTSKAKQEAEFNLFLALLPESYNVV